MRLKWPGFNNEGTVVFELSDGYCYPLKDEIDVFGELYSAKAEQHITLIGTRLGELLLRAMKQDQTIESLLARTFEEIDWSFKQSGPVHILSREQDGIVQKSIIILVDMPGVMAFYQQLKALGIIDPDTPLPPPHITLYTLNCPTGIGVPSQKILDILSIKTLSVEAFEQIDA
jgi:hypothetical protein